MVPTATLRAYEPLDAFEAPERAYWQDYAAAVPGSREPRAVIASREAIGGALGTAVAEREEADLLERDGRTLVCPLRSRLRFLASLLALARTMPAEAAGAFLPEDALERAAAEIGRLRSEHPRWRNHILQSPWEVPLRWFVPFDDAERRTVAVAAGPSLRYETSVDAARGRLAAAEDVLRGTLPSRAAIALVADLAEWLGPFHGGGVVVLDYGGVARLFSPSEIEADRSCREVWWAIRALQEGDLQRAAAAYGVVAERWAGRRARASMN